MKWRSHRVRYLALALVVLGLAAPAKAILFYTGRIPEKSQAAIVSSCSED